MSPEPARRRVLITGATSGLGREMVVQLAREGCRIAFTGRREAKLTETEAIAKEAGAAAGAELLPLQGSVTDMEDVRAHYARIHDAWGGVDWAIFNAGVGDTNNAKAFVAQTVSWTFDTNIMGVANWLEVVIPDMLAQDDGVIVGISSIAGWRGLPQSAAYSASKAALITLLESVRIDLRKTGVDVVTVCPGYVKSEITARNDPKQMLFLMETADGVRAILRGVRKRKRMVHFPLRLSIPCLFLLRWMPSVIYEWLAGKIERKKDPYVDESARA